MAAPPLSNRVCAKATVPSNPIELPRRFRSRRAGAVCRRELVLECGVCPAALAIAIAPSARILFPARSSSATLFARISVLRDLADSGPSPQLRNLRLMAALSDYTSIIVRASPMKLGTHFNIWNVHVGSTCSNVVARHGKFAQLRHR